MLARILTLILVLALAAPSAAQDLQLLGESAKAGTPPRRASRPDPSKPWIVLPSAGGVKIVQITSVKVTISRGSKKSDGKRGR